MLRIGLKSVLKSNYLKRLSCIQVSTFSTKIDLKDVASTEKPLQTAQTAKAKHLIL